MNKAEMLEHHARYGTLMAQARQAEKAGLYRQAVAHALASWEHIDGMMQYDRRYNKREFKSIPAVDLTLKYAPLLLDYPNLDRLEALLKERRGIEKKTSVNLADRLAAARAEMWDAHRLWGHLERNPAKRQDELRQKLGGRQKQWDKLVERWVGLGLVRRDADGPSYRLRLATQMNDLVPAKCSACGHALEISKGMCMASMPCPKCDQESLFVILSRQAS
jgi:predicted RNA-binding Zn-ribbon protein involved in translation (DUF1610 family)